MITKLLMYLRLYTADTYKKKSIYSKYLGIKFGDNVRILSFPRWGSEPYLIEIGNNVTITRGVCFLNHDGGVALFRDEFPGLNLYGKIKIGNNVFIGINSVIMPGVTIGNNVVIGAGSLVNRNVPDNVVVAGVPAKFIKSISDYKEKALSNPCYINTKDPDEKREIINKYLDNR